MPYANQPMQSEKYNLISGKLYGGGGPALLIVPPHLNGGGKFYCM